MKISTVLYIMGFILFILVAMRREISGILKLKGLEVLEIILIVIYVVLLVAAYIIYRRETK